MKARIPNPMAHPGYAGLSRASSALLLTLSIACGDDEREPLGDGEGSTSSDTEADATTGGSQTNGSETSSEATSSAEATAASEDSASGSDTTGEAADLLTRVIEGLGGQDNLENMERFEMTLEGARRVPDEGFSPGDPPLPASTFETLLARDLVGGGLRNDITRTSQFVPLPDPLEVEEVIARDLGVIIGTESVFGFPGGDMLTDRWASTLKQDRLLNPHSLLLDVLVGERDWSQGGSADFEDRPHELLEIEDDVFPITLWVDSETDRIARLTTMENSPLHRDSELEVVYGQWAMVDGGIAFPTTVELSLGGEVIHEETRASVSINPELPEDAFAFPPDSDPQFVAADAQRGERNSQFHQIFASIGIPLDGQQTFVQGEELAPGVHFLTGGSHHSMAIEQADGVVVFESPLYEARCLALADWIETNLPDRPITHLVVSHHHEDHAACARSFVAQGATLVVHESARTFFEEILAAPSTIEPDALADSAEASFVIETVPEDGVLQLDSAVNPVSVYHFDNTHAQDLVLPFVEGPGVLFTVDVYSPGFTTLVPSGPQEVLDAIEANDLLDAVGVIAGGHGGAGTLAELQALVAED